MRVIPHYRTQLSSQIALMKHGTSCGIALRALPSCSLQHYLGVCFKAHCHQSQGDCSNMNVLLGVPSQL